MDIDIARLASLARLRIEPGDMEKFGSKLRDIVAMVERLPELTEETLALDIQNPMVLRPDEVTPSLRREEILANAPQTEAGCVVVPRTLE